MEGITWCMVDVFSGRVIASAIRNSLVPNLLSNKLVKKSKGLCFSSPSSPRLQEPIENSIYFIPVVSPHQPASITASSESLRSEEYLLNESTKLDTVPCLPETCVS